MKLLILLLSVAVIFLAYKYGELRYRDGMYAGADAMLEAENYRDSLRKQPSPVGVKWDHVFIENINNQP